MMPSVKNRSWIRQSTAARPKVQLPKRNHRYSRIAAQLARMAYRARFCVSLASWLSKFSSRSGCGILAKASWVAFRTLLSFATVHRLQELHVHPLEAAFFFSSQPFDCELLDRRSQLRVFELAGSATCSPVPSEANAGFFVSGSSKARVASL